METSREIRRSPKWPDLEIKGRQTQWGDFKSYPTRISGDLRQYHRPTGRDVIVCLNVHGKPAPDGFNAIGGSGKLTSIYVDARRFEIPEGTKFSYKIAPLNRS